MTEESKSAEGGAAVAEAPEPPAEGATPPEPAGPTPITIPRAELTEEARKQAIEELGRETRDIPYAVLSEDKRPHCLAVLKFQIDAEEFQKELNRFYEDLRKEVTLPGYRKGKAPVRLIRIRMGEDADRDAMGETALNVLRQEVLKRPLKLLADPRIIGWKIKEGEALEFEIEVELEPTIELKEYKGLAVKVGTREIDDAAVEAQLEKLRREHARQESAPEGTRYGEGHTAVIDLHVVGEKGQELANQARSNWLVENPARELPEPVAAKLVGMAVGESANVPVQWSRRNRRGETVETVDTFTVAVKDIKETKLAALDDEFAKDLGEHETLADLRAAIRKDLEAAEQERQKNVSVAKIVAAIIEKNPVESPRSLIANLELDSIMRDSYQLSRMGLKLQDVVTDPTAYLQTQHASAGFRVQQDLLLAELAKIEKLEVSDADLEAEISRMAEESGRKPLAIRARLEAEKKLEGLRELLVKRKLFEFLLANNTIEKAPEAEAEPAPPEVAAPSQEGSATDS